MKEPIKYQTFTEEEKNEFIVLTYIGYKIEIEDGRFIHNEGSCPVEFWGSKEETYLKIVKDLINYAPCLSQFRRTKSWDKIIPIILNLRQEKNYTKKYKNQLNNIDYWLNKLNIDMVSRYVAGAINILNGKRGVTLTI